MAGAMNPAAFSVPPAPRLDVGVLVLLLLLLGALLGLHLLRRRALALEAALAAAGQEAEVRTGRYREAFRALGAPAAFVDRVTGLVVEATPGWCEAGLPEPGARICAPEEEALWRSLPVSARAEDPPPAQVYILSGRAFRALSLSGASQGLVLLLPR